MRNRPALLFLLCSFFLIIPAGFSAETNKAKEKKEEIRKVPSFPRKGIWLTARPLDKNFFDGKATLVYFWDYTSINSIREIGILKKWAALYHPYGFQMLWIHAPEFPFAARRENVAGAARRFKIPYPIFLDNDFKLWDAYQVRSWPTKILVNDDREIVYSDVGESGYVDTEKKIRDLLRRVDPGAVLPAPVFDKEIPKYSVRECGLMSNETYYGYKKAEWWGAELANKQWMPRDKAVMFKDRGERVEHGFFAEGLWISREEDMEHAHETKELTDYLGLMYTAHEVYGVLNQKGEAGKPAWIYVTRDGEPVPSDLRGRDLEEDESGRTYFKLRQPRLYYLIANEDKHFHELKFWTQTEGVAVNSFSFSNRCLSDFEHL